MGVRYEVGPRGGIKVGGKRLPPGTPLDPELIRSWHNLPAYITTGRIVVAVEGDSDDDAEEQRRQEWLAQRNAGSRGRPQVASTAAPEEPEEEPEPEVEAEVEVEEESEEEFVCDVCGFEAKNAAGLGSHMRSHSEEDE